MQISSEGAPDIAVSIRHIGKQYRLGETAVYASLRDRLTNMFSRRETPKKRELFWALHDVSFDVQRGEVLGVIGRNGAGKSTLLKILSRITDPTTGEIHLFGRVSSLLEVGTGFHPELTGRENVFLNGSILGMTKAEIRRKFDEIVAFAEIDEFLDTPVKRYSSGMYVRLAFSVAAHLEPDILIVDEVLAVGDTAFQQKCLGKMHEVTSAGRTVIVVSHNMNTVSALCSRVAWIAHGELRQIGPSGRVISAYLSEGAFSEFEWSSPVSGDRAISFNRVQLLGEVGGPASTFAADEQINVDFDFTVERRLPPTHLSLHLLTEDGQLLVMSLSSDQTPHLNHEIAVGSHRFVCSIPGGLLRPGRYFITLWEPTGDKHVDNPGILSFIVTEANSLDARHGQYATIAPVFTWKIDQK